jgi:sterol desaturase/sphingolipid hydroxylase (fatty acid hydroxylase superfamily)
MDDAPSIVALIVAFAVLGAVFWTLERLMPAVRGQRRRRRDTTADVAYWFFTPLVTRAITKIGLAVVFLAIALSQGVPLRVLAAAADTRETWVRSWPVWLQMVVLLLLADLLAYWTHRAFHGRRLWRFHAVHHSSRTLDWLSSVRLHPLNDAAVRIVQVVPLYFLGFNGAVLAAFVPFITLHGILLHANVPWTFGPLRCVLASPAFHRWHHTSEDEGLDTNFAGLFPFIDLAFGTFYLPRDRQPTRFGLVHEDVPDGLLRQLLYPFTRTPRPASSIDADRLH